MFDTARLDQDIAAIALEGLRASPKTLPPKLFYDVRGVALFEAITALPEYYLTRTERALLARIAPELASFVPDGAALVEYGGCDEAKALLLLDSAGDRFAAYVPIDVAGEALSGIAERLRASRPDLGVLPVCADFMQPLSLPEGVKDVPKIGFFPGSTIGNLEPAAAGAFLARARATLGPGAWMIVGVDLRKPAERLIPAYDDAQGVTAAFNLNLLRRLNREAGANFAISAFSHRAVWNEADSRIEMHLVSKVRQTVTVAGVPVQFAAGETIHTENSYKHSLDGFAQLASGAGWDVCKAWTDDAGLFSIHALRAPGGLS
jgi:dimethylhistidine N-methyltransferase